MWARCWYSDDKPEGKHSFISGWYKNKVKIANDDIHYATVTIFSRYCTVIFSIWSAMLSILCQWYLLGGFHSTCSADLQAPFSQAELSLVWSKGFFREQRLVMILTLVCLSYECLSVPARTFTDNAISRVSRKTSAMKRAFGVGAVSIDVAVVGKMWITIRYASWRAFVYIWRSIARSLLKYSACKE